MSVRLGKARHRLCRAVNDYKAAGSIGYVALNHAARRAELKGLIHIVVSIDALAGHGSESKAGLHISAVYDEPHKLAPGISAA